MIIDRTLLPQILHWIGRPKIIILKGSRQVGKTTLLHIIKDRLDTEGAKTLYFNIDQELENPIFENSKSLLRFIRDQFSQRDEKLYLFLDEFQYLKDGGLFLKTLFDASEDSIQIIASGSSGLEITNTSEFLTGRKIEFNLYPLSYYEFVTYKTQLSLPQNLSLRNFSEIQEFYSVYKEKIAVSILEYLSFGGYPEIVTTTLIEDKLSILKELMRTYLEKDVIAFLRVENVSGFNNLLKVLCSQVGNLVNKSELGNTINLNSETLRKYLDILEGTYLIELVQSYFTNVRKQISKMPKVYIDDAGFRNIVLNAALPLQLISGAERENFVYNALKQKYGRDSVKFYRTISKAEVDFVLEIPEAIIPVEVKSIKKKISVPAVMKSLQKTHSIIVTDDYLAREEGVFFIPTALLPFIDIRLS